MAEKRYYWLKLYKDFFTSKRIKMLRSIRGGDTYTIIYLKMQLKALDTDGYLYFDGYMNDFAEELALDIDETVENVKMTIQFLLNVGLLESNTDGTDYKLTYMDNLIGSETASSQRVRDYRNRQKEVKTLQCNENVTSSRCNNNIITLQCNDKSLHYNGEKDLEIKKDIEYNNSAHTCEEKPVENSLDPILKYRAITVKGEWNKGSLFAFISDEQLDALEKNYDADTLAYYFNKLNELHAAGYKHGCSDYEYIIRLIEEDRKVRKNE